MDIPSEVRNTILIRILSQKTLVPKKTYSWDVKYLVAIFILEYETNYTYKRIRREEMISAIDHKQIAPKQYSRPQCISVAHKIDQGLVFDYQQYQQQPFSLACCDL